MSNNRKRKRREKRRTALFTVVLMIVLAAFVILMPHETTYVALNATETGVMSTHAGLMISEVMTDNVSAYPDEKGLFGDWIEIVNTTESEMNIKGVGLSDRNDKIIFLFPDITLLPDGRVIVFADNVNKDDPSDVLHAKFKLSSLGESVFLYDRSGVCIDSVKVPTLNKDESYARSPDTGEFVKTEYYSPLFENSAAGHEAYKNSYEIAPGLLLINEVCPSPKSGLRDEDGECSDWLELYNLSDADIDLSGFALSDDETKPIKWIFPKGAVIPANGFYLVFCSGKDKVETLSGYPHTNFSINNSSETLLLSNLAGKRIDLVKVSGIEKDMSYARDPDSLEWIILTLPTPGAANNKTGMNKADKYIRAINPYGVYISEVMSSASAIRAVSGLTPRDYVEIHNDSSAPVNLSGWGLSDNINWPDKWTFPYGTVIYPGEYKIILLDKDQSDATRLHANFSLSREGGEIVTLADPARQVIDRMYIPQLPTDVSYGRTQGAGGFFYYDAPTPGAVNGSGFLGYAEEPVFVHPSGLYMGALQVEITVPSGTTVRYTTDGSVPTVDNGTVYTGPVEITEPTVFRARSWQNGLQPGNTVTASYIMNTYHSLDVVSLICDPEELWNPTNGLMSEAPDLKKCEVVNKEKLPFKTPVYRTYGKIDRPGYVEIFDCETGEAYISQGIKMDLLGDYSLDMPQKSFKVRAQAAYGEKYFNYPLFDSRAYTYYKSFTLRNSGNDNVWTRVADGVQTRLVDKYLNSPMLTLAWQPVIVYLNGEYWGHYNMRERKDRFSIAQFEGLDMEDTETLDAITILRAGWGIVQGSNAEYKAMLKVIEGLDPNRNPADLQYLYDHIDIDNYIEWYSVKMYFGDSDPGNIMFYKLPGEGSKWKCLLFDLDYGLFNSGYDSPKSYLKTSGMGQQNINNTIFRKMIESDEIRGKYLTRLGQIFRILTTDVMIAELDECTAIIKPELLRHYSRWAEYKEPTINSDSPTSATGYMRYWQQRVDRMKETMSLRPYKFWGLVQTQFHLTDAQMNYYFGPRPVNPGA